MPTTTEPRTLLTLDVNNAGSPFIGGCDFDDRGMGVRSYVLSSTRNGEVCARIMRRRFDDMVRLMGDNIESEVTDAFLTAETLEIECEGLDNLAREV